MVVEADGGSRGNPGPAGYGAVVRDGDTGELLREIAAGIGTATNNVAEYRGLLAGLEAARELGADEVDVRMDSLLVVNQMSGVWQIKHAGMRPLAAEAAGLVRAFRRVTFTHIRREYNKHADRLANEAMDAAARGREWSAPPQLEPEPAPAPVPAPAPQAPHAPKASGWSAPSGAATRMLLARHGSTEMSAERRFSGRGDVPLTDLGLTQAAALAERLASSGAGLVVSSPLQRARQTAAAIAARLGVPLVTDDDLAETDFGAWEGFTFAEVQQRWPAELNAWLANPDVAPPGGESFTATTARVAAARDRLTAAHPDETLVLVSHVTPIKTLLRLALDAPPSALYRMHLDPASLSAVTWYADGPAVVTGLNDTAHLAQVQA